MAGLGTFLAMFLSVVGPTVRRVTTEQSEPRRPTAGDEEESEDR
jgi:hypothetical protein